MSSRWISTSFIGGLPAGPAGVDLGMGRLDQRGLAHAACAPQQGVVGRQATGEALGVLDQGVARPVDAGEQAHLHPRHLAAPGSAGARVPTGRRRRRRIEGRRGRRRGPLQRGGDALEQRHQGLEGRGARHRIGGFASGSVRRRIYGDRPGKSSVSASAGRASEREPGSGVGYPARADRRSAGEGADGYGTDDPDQPGRGLRLHGRFRCGACPRWPPTRRRRSAAGPGRSPSNC